jgi:hypothetical protein
LKSEPAPVCCFDAFSSREPESTSLENAMKGTSSHRHRYRFMPIEPPEIPPATPGTPTEPPLESPPGSPRPEVPAPVREPGESPRPEELPGKVPEELPVRGPSSPTTPNPAVDGPPATI